MFNKKQTEAFYKDVTFCKSKRFFLFDFQALSYLAVHLLSDHFSLWWTYTVKEATIITKKPTEEFRSGCEGEVRGRLWFKQRPVPALTDPGTARAGAETLLYFWGEHTRFLFSSRVTGAVVKALTSPPALSGTRTSQELLWASPWLVEEALIIFFFVHLTPRKLDSTHSWKKRTETTSRLVGSCGSWGVNSDSGPVWTPSLSVKQATLTAVILQTCLQHLRNL